MTTGTIGQGTVERQDEVFGPIISAYTRAQALEDGLQIDVSETAAEAGVKWPTYLTAGVWARCVEVPTGVSGQDERGRLWDVLWMMSTAARCRRQVARVDDDPTEIRFSVAVRNDNLDSHPYNRGGPRIVQLKACAGPRLLTLDDADPCILVMLPEED